jgi:hypothetical protein
LIGENNKFDKLEEIWGFVHKKRRVLEGGCVSGGENLQSVKNLDSRTMSARRNLQMSTFLISPSITQISGVTLHAA